MAPVKVEQGKYSEELYNFNHFHELIDWLKINQSIDSYIILLTGIMWNYYSVL